MPLTLNDLLNSTGQHPRLANRPTKGGRTTFNHCSEPQLGRVIPVPNLDTTGLLVIEAYFDPQPETLNSVRGSSGSTYSIPDVYSTILMFEGLHFYDDHKSGTIPVELARDHWVYMVKPSLRDSYVRVWCNCPDYFYTWWYHNKHKYQAHALTDFPPYTRVYPPSGLPRRNPTKIAGVCKHIARLAKVAPQQLRNYIRA